ncbi:MAG: malate dehydrogenase [Armatimonadetes bacterium]|nr:malate dehydrogenase [Armatimonadota bacterium]
MKVAIVGGGGRVGSNAAYALQIGGLMSEIAIVDVNRELAEGEALDLRHGSSIASASRIVGGGFEACAGAHVVVVTAGLRRKPDESRLDLINRNVALFRGVLDEMRNASLAKDCILFVVSNPVDILTHLAVQSGIFAPSRVIGLGTVLDTARFRSHLADALGVDATQISALILGEHGDSMVPIWSSAAVNGVPLSSLPSYRPNEVAAIFDQTKKSGARVISLKGGAGYAVGLGIKQVVEAIALDKKAILPVSSLQNGLFGIKDICLSLPTRIGRGGVEELVEIALWDKERMALQRSAEVLKETLSAVS